MHRLKIYSWHLTWRPWWRKDSKTQTSGSLLFQFCFVVVDLFQNTALKMFVVSVLFSGCRIVPKLNPQDVCCFSLVSWLQDCSKTRPLGWLLFTLLFCGCRIVPNSASGWLLFQVCFVAADLFPTLPLSIAVVSVLLCGCRLVPKLSLRMSVVALGH